MNFTQNEMRIQQAPTGHDSDSNIWHAGDTNKSGSLKTFFDYVKRIIIFILTVFLFILFFLDSNTTFSNLALDICYNLFEVLWNLLLFTDGLRAEVMETQSDLVFCH